MKSTLPLEIHTQVQLKKTATAMTAGFLLVGLTFSAPFLLAAKDKKDKNKTAESSKTLAGLPTQGLTEDEAILQALNRLGFGPKPGDVERVKEMGLQKWVDQQLHPESIPDSALEARLERFPTLKMSSSKLLDEFPQPRVAARREGVSLEEYRKEQQEQNKSAAQAMQSDMQMADPQGMPNFDVGQQQPTTECSAWIPKRNPGKAGEARAKPDSATRCSITRTSTPRRGSWPNSPWPRSRAPCTASGSLTR